MGTASRQHRTPLGLFPDRPSPRLDDRTVKVLRVRHDSRRMEGGGRTEADAVSAARPTDWLVDPMSAKPKQPNTQRQT